MHKCDAFIEIPQVFCHVLKQKYVIHYLNIHLSGAVLDLNLVGNIKFGCHPKIMIFNSRKELHLGEKSNLQKLCPQ